MGPRGGNLSIKPKKSGRNIWPLASVVDTYVGSIMMVSKHSDKIFSFMMGKKTTC